MIKKTAYTPMDVTRGWATSGVFHRKAIYLAGSKRLGGKDPTKVDITKTTTQEQRATEWMSFESLANALNPNNPQLTIEGYQAPIRELIIARKE